LINDRTRAIVPVHLGGASADLDAVQAIASRRKIAVVEDACQAHLGEWRGKKVGSMGTTGCFSFQASKNLNSGEGGALLTNSEDIVERSYTYHNNGRGRKTAGYDFSYRTGGLNLRMTEFQATLLLTQMARLEEQSRTREQNAQYLTSMLKEIPGIAPAKMYEGCTRNAYHLYMFRYDPAKFAGAPRQAFLKAMSAEGIPCSSGYAPLNKEPFLANALASSGYKAVYPAERIARWKERNQCPANDRLCEEAVWFTQTMLLGPRRDMDQIVEAVRKIQSNAAELARV
jgi:dTDP-4-amino-4,6-dideoxygalactose transaminase